jgi:hypothetical protein
MFTFGKFRTFFWDSTFSQLISVITQYKAVQLQTTWGGRGTLYHTRLTTGLMMKGRFSFQYLYTNYGICPVKHANNNSSHKVKENMSLITAKIQTRRFAIPNSTVHSITVHKHTWPVLTWPGHTDTLTKAELKECHGTRNGFLNPILFAICTTRLMRLRCCLYGCAHLNCLLLNFLPCVSV